MEWPDVRHRIEAGEDRHTEFKRGLGDLAAIGRAMCAFANTEGGLIILGVEDDRTITGVKEDAEGAQERLTSFLQTGCSAPVHARTGRFEEPAGWVHWIEIPRQRGFEPIRLRRSCSGAPRAQQRRAIGDGTSGTLQRVDTFSPMVTRSPRCHARAHRPGGLPRLFATSGIRHDGRSAAGQRG